MPGTVKILGGGKKEVERQPVTPTTASVLTIDPDKVDVSEEKCALCLSVFGKIVDGALVERHEFCDAKDKAAFTTNYNVSGDSAVCAKCVKEDADAPRPAILDSACKMGHAERLAYISQEDIALELIKAPEGMMLLANTGYLEYGQFFRQTALHVAVSGSERVAMELIKTSEGRRLLTETKRYHVETRETINNDFVIRASRLSALRDAAVKWERVAMGLIRTPEGRRLLLADADIDADGSTFHTAVIYHERVAMELIRTKEGRKLLKKTRYSDGESLFHVAADWHDSFLAESKRYTARGRILSMLRAAIA